MSCTSVGNFSKKGIMSCTSVGNFSEKGLCRVRAWETFFNNPPISPNIQKINPRKHYRNPILRGENKKFDLKRKNPKIVFQILDGIFSKT